VTTTFAYRGDGLRDSRTVSGGATTTFTWDIAGGLPVVLDDGNQYLYGAGLTAQKQSGNWYYYLADGLGSTMAVVNASGTVQDSYTYDVYGTPTKTGSLSNEFDFAGQQTDGTGLQYLRARYYDPATGSLLSRDPLGLSRSWTESPTGYAAGSPTNLSDPTGLYWGESKVNKVADGAKAAGSAAVGAGQAAGGAVAGTAQTAWEDRKAIAGQCVAWGVSGLVYGAVTGGVAGAATGAVGGCAMGAISQLVSHVDGPLGAGLQCLTWGLGTAATGGGTAAQVAACAAGIAGTILDSVSGECAAWGLAGLIAGSELLASGGRAGLPAVGAITGCFAGGAATPPPVAALNEKTGG
jgi:RHS repeat-associated protein